MTETQPRTLRKKELGRIVRDRILPQVNDERFVQWDDEAAVAVNDEILLEIGFQRSQFDQSVYLGGCVFPLYVPQDAPVLPGTLGGRSNYLFPGTAAAFDMKTDTDISTSVQTIVGIVRNHLIPFLDSASSSRAILDLFEMGSMPPVFRPGRRDWHGCFVMGFVSAYCGQFDRVPVFFQASRASLADCHAAHDDARRFEMAQLESLLGDRHAVAHHLATNAKQTRRLLQLPFSLDLAAYDLNSDWSSERQ